MICSGDDSDVQSKKEKLLEMSSENDEVIQQKENPGEFSQPFEKLNDIRPSCKSPQSISRLSAEERRRKILEKSEERLQRILGHSHDPSNENLHRHMPVSWQYRSSSSTQKLNTSVSSTDFDLSCDSKNVWPVPYPVVLLIMVLIVKLILSPTFLGTYAFQKNCSFVLPFIVIESCYMINMQMNTQMSIVDKNLIFNLGKVQKFFKVLHNFLFMFQEFMWHFSVYFVSLCLVHLVI